jgi:hypothetical protein
LKSFGFNTFQIILTFINDKIKILHSLSSLYNSPPTTSSVLFCPYQKDERALPGNLVVIRYSFSPPPQVIKCLSFLSIIFSLLYSSAILPNFLSISIFRGLRNCITVQNWRYWC